MAAMARLLKGLPLLIASPFLVAGSFLTLALADVLFAAFGRKRKPSDRRPQTDAASVVIPNWNGRDLLEKYLPSVIAATAANPRNEVIVVDNGSTDGSVEFLRREFPQVRVLALGRNLGFGGGSNVGFRAATNDIVVLLNNDMRVAPDFLAPLLEGFEDERVFAVSCQIFFSDPEKVREETGLTQGWWAKGQLRVRHRSDPKIGCRYPCFYAGGGSSAYDRHKFLELGGFDPLFEPFYGEDTDLGLLAWKRGWKVYYEPRSVVWHEHRGTIGRRFSASYIDSIVNKNFLLLVWKNIHATQRMAAHFLRTWADAVFSYAAGESRERASLVGLGRAFAQLPRAVVSRWRARALAEVSDEEALKRPMGGYFLDRFAKLSAAPETLNVLFVSPYPIYPPVHGGGVFMYGTCKELAARCRLHLAAVVDKEWQIEQHEPLARQCASAQFFIRPSRHEFGIGAIEPHAVREIAMEEVEWAIHRTLYLEKIDVVQLEYANMAHYAGRFGRIVTALFEHDIYFQSIARQLRRPGPPLRKATAFLEYLRALRYELQALRQMDLIQVCSRENREHLLSFLPELRGRVDETLRAGIETESYRMSTGPREPYTMLFLGSFRHTPNQEALDWFIKQVLPRVVAQCPQARLVIVGSDPPPRHSLPADDRNLEIRGYVEDLMEPFARYAVFACPVLSGSGVRVKLLEAFASGIPVVSTRLGAEGLTSEDGQICRLADTPEEFAARIVDIFEGRASWREMVARARAYVEEQRDIARMTERLVDVYRRLVSEKRSALVASERGLGR